jgi:hypothetical protein
LKRLGWFLLIYIASVAVLGGLALLVRAVLRP